MSPAANTQKNNPRLLKARAEAEAKRRAAEQAAAAQAAAASVVSGAEGEDVPGNSAALLVEPADEKRASSSAAAAPRREEALAGCAPEKGEDPADGGASERSHGKRKQFKGKRAKAKTGLAEDRDAASSQEPAAEEEAFARDQAPLAEPESEPESDAAQTDETAAEGDAPRAAKPVRKKSVANKKRAVGQASTAHDDAPSEKEEGKEASGGTGASRSARAGAAGVSGKRRAKTIAIITSVLVVIAILGAAVGGFAFARWYAHDDAADFTGTWYIAGTDTPVIITESLIELNDEVSYAYTLDADAKTLTFTFGNMAGNATYRFSLDRSELAVADGEYSWGDTLSRDIGWYASAFVSALTGEQSSPALGDDGMLLTRTSASMQALIDQAKAEQEGAGFAAEGSSSDAAGAETPAEDGSASSPADGEEAA